ncbi:PQQ-dependent sugar dehydrogenase [Nocardia sp. CA2R105]|uniref:PQQ-dependent sugar dehydrogenase n=1 Tax=Nocardia coffeae TaxID=2873381 RepID=UPI001CA78280|nr:PQQ-dependent sugar dehydrogenase [Nocardia coffeae]MBY8856347.1 PQQ-dependent sugar dehydrogenase [Nocardia coffeae]
MSVVVAGRIAVSLAVAAGLLAGCASFDDSASKPFTPAPSISPEGSGPTTTPQTKPSTPKRAAGPCVDSDPSVVVSCLDTTGGLTVLPDGQQALVAERVTGRILKVVNVDPSEIPPTPTEAAKVDVDAAGDGGLTAVALSPTYDEDGLMYAYVTTASDNRIVRIGAGGVPKPILTGIPKGATGNRGAIDFVSASKMVVETGNAGDPGAAGNPNSLAGKVFTIDNPGPGSANPKILASGIGTAGGICPDHKDTIWFTDRTATEDRLQRVDANGTVSTGWTWPDRPGVGGCAAAADGVAVSLAAGKALAFANADQNTHAITTPPTMVAQNKYGQLNGASLAPDGYVWVDTVNKPSAAGPLDDRVVRIPPPKGGSGNGSPD